MEGDDDCALLGEGDCTRAGAASEVEHALAAQVAEEAQFLIRRGLVHAAIIARGRGRYGELLSVRTYSPFANRSTISRASSSWYCTAGDFMK